MAGDACTSDLRTGVVIDNGAGSLKIGRFELASASEPTVHVIPNALARPGPSATVGERGKSKRPHGMLVGAEISRAQDVTGMQFRRAHDRGYVAKWDDQRDIWASALSDDMGIGLLNPSQAKLVLSEPPAMPSHMKHAQAELVFETFGFGALATAAPAQLVLASLHDVATNSPKNRSALIVDSGFSFTHATPVVDGKVIDSAVRRLNVGGKALTNHLKELITFRSWNMMEETAVVNAVKERTCYVSQDFDEDLDKAKDRKSTMLRTDYILPDMSRHGADHLGHIKEPDEEMDNTEQILTLANERFSVPELLFSPIDIGMDQCGLAELILNAVEASPVENRADLFANIVLVGGNCLFPGFQKRIYSELRPRVPDMYDVSIIIAPEPITSAFYGGVRVLKDNLYSIPFVSKAEYEEHGRMPGTGDP